MANASEQVGAVALKQSERSGDRSIDWCQTWSQIHRSQSYISMQRSFVLIV